MLKPELEGKKPESKRDKKFRTKYIAGKTQSSNEQQTNGKTYTRSYKVEDSDQSFEACIASTEKGSVYGNTTFTGSNFTTNNTTIYDAHTAEQKNICLDGSYSTYTKDEKGKLTGIGISFCDANGHGDDEKGDKALAEIAFSASKVMVNALMEYENPDDLKEALNTVIENSAKKLRGGEWTKQGMPTTTALAARTYPTAGGDRVIGFGIGDGMLTVWEPKKQAFRTLIPSVQLGSDKMGFGAANFPTTYTPQEIYYCDEIIEEGAILIPMTDGISDYLPLIHKDDTIINSKGLDSGRRTTVLDETQMNKILAGPPLAKTQEECIKRITNMALKESENVINSQIKKANAVKESKLKKLKQQNEDLSKKKIKAEKDLKKIATLEEKIQSLGSDKYIQLGDDLHIGGFQVPIKTVEIFRPFIDGKMLISLENIESQIKEYLSLFPKAEREKKFSEIMEQKDETLNYLKETKDVDLIKIDRLDRTLIYLKENKHYGKRLKQPSPMTSFLEIVDALKDKKITDLAEGDLKRLFSDTIKAPGNDNEFHDKITNQIELLGIEFLEKIEQSWKGEITPQFVELVEQLFDKMDKQLTQDPRWIRFWTKLDPKPDNIKKTQERILHAYRFKIISIIFTNLNIVSDQQKSNLGKLLQGITHTYDNRKEDISFYKQIENEYRNKSGPLYVNAVNNILKEAIDKKIQGKEAIKEYLTNSRTRIMSPMGGDKYAKYFSPEKAEDLVDEIFPLEVLQSKIEGYNQKCVEVGYDINKKIDVLTYCSGGEFIKKCSSAEVKKISDFQALLITKAYYKGHANTYNDDIKKPFDEKDEKNFKEWENEINQMLVKYDLKGLLDSQLLESVSKHDIEQVKTLIELGADPNSATTNYKGSIWAANAFNELKEGNIINFFKNLTGPPPLTASKIATLMGEHDMSTYIKVKEIYGDKFKDADKLNIIPTAVVLPPLPQKEMRNPIEINDKRQSLTASYDQLTKHKGDGELRKAANTQVVISQFVTENIDKIKIMLEASKNSMKKLESQPYLTLEDRDRIKESITTGDEALTQVLNYLIENQSKVTENDKKFAKFVQKVLKNANAKPNLPLPNTVNLLIKLSTISKAKRKERPG